jgi:hypothetical protein
LCVFFWEFDAIANSFYPSRHRYTCAPRSFNIVFFLQR